MSYHLTHQDRALVTIANNRKPCGWNAHAVASLEKQGLVTTDPEWSGCLALTEAGWRAYDLLDVAR